MDGGLHETDKGTQLIFKLCDDGEYVDPTGAVLTLVLKRYGATAAETPIVDPDVTVWADPEEVTEANRVLWVVPEDYFVDKSGTWFAWVTADFTTEKWTNPVPVEFTVARAAA